MRFQVEYGAAGRLAERGAVVREKLDVAEVERAAEDAGLHALDVVDVAEDAGDGFRLVAAGVADGEPDKVDQAAFDARLWYRTGVDVKRKATANLGCSTKAGRSTRRGQPRVPNGVWHSGL